MASADRHGVRRQLSGTCALQPLQKSGCVGRLEGGHGVGGGLDSSLSNYQKASFVVALGTWRPRSRRRW